MDEVREYALGTSLKQRYPWGLFAGGRALCPDGRVRALARISTTADTFFSVPAAVKAHGKTVAGYVTVETVEGFSTPTELDPSVVRFIPYTYGRNGNVFA